VGVCVLLTILSMPVMLPFRDWNTPRTVLVIESVGRRYVHVWNHEDLL